MINLKVTANTNANVSLRRRVTMNLILIAGMAYTFIATLLPTWHML